MSRFKVDSLEFKCATLGNHGPLLVFLHGFGGGPVDFHNLSAPLESRFRILLPNITPFFSSVEPISFSRQVKILRDLLLQVIDPLEQFVIVGSSYGGTLSWGLRSVMEKNILGSVMVNPMPIDPLQNLKSHELRQFFGMNMVPGALPLFLKTRPGKDMLAQLAGVFGLGAGGHRELGGLTERKLMLVAKAVQRFAWIAQHEDWEAWREACREQTLPTLIVTGEVDPLFNERDFRSYQMFCGLSEHLGLAGAGHLAVRTHADQIASALIAFTEMFSHDAEPAGLLKAVI